MDFIGLRGGIYLASKACVRSHPDNYPPVAALEYTVLQQMRMGSMH